MVFCEVELANITATDVERYLRLKAYGVAEIHTTLERPTLCRSNTLEVYKKAISYFIPNRIPHWDPISKIGNPTKSVDVNQVIKDVRKHEVRTEGAQSRVKRDLSRPEFLKAINLFCDRNNFVNKYRNTCMMKLQYHLIARSDDIAHIKLRDLEPHSDPRFRPFALQVKVRWSKAVVDERRCPNQIFLGSMDTDFCILLSLSLYLEEWMRNGNGKSCQYLFSSDEATNAKVVERVKTTYRANLLTIFNHEEFKVLMPEGAYQSLGSHSLRKFASTWARQNGCTMDEIEIRGRWRSNTQRTLDRYVNVEQPHVDTKVEGVLCVGGPIRYKLVPDSGVTPEWLKLHVVPGISSFYDNDSFLLVLALPLLWASLDHTEQSRVPPVLANRIQQAYEELRVLDAAINPVQRVLLTVYQIQERVCIDEVLPMVGEDGEIIPQQQQQGRNIITQDHINGIFVQLQQQRQQLEAAVERFESKTTTMSKHFDNTFNILNKNINRIAVQPPRMATQDQVHYNNDRLENEVNNPPALLSRCPRSLFDLWTEYQYGVGGNKAAKHFTYKERGRCKCTYSKRKIVWDTIDRLLRSGAQYTAVTAIDEIHRCYGQGLSVTAIINLMAKDKARGGHENLR